MYILNVIVVSLLAHFLILKDYSLQEILSLGIENYFILIYLIIVDLGFIIWYTINVYYSNTMKYSVCADSVGFEWGLIKKSKVDIPFDDIVSLNIVKYHNSEYSTIFFGTIQKYRIKKLNFDTGEIRAGITFEKVPMGDKVYEMLDYLRLRAHSKIS